MYDVTQIDTLFNQPCWLSDRISTSVTGGSGFDFWGPGHTKNFENGSNGFHPWRLGIKG